MEVFAIANKNIKMLFKNVLFIIFLTVVPLFMIYFMKSTTDTTSNLINASEAVGFVETVILSPANGDHFTNLFTSGILVQFLLLASVLAASMVVEEREGNTLMRLFVAPISKFKILLGTLIGHSVFVTAVASLIILLTGIFFDITWGNSLINIIIVTLLAVYVATSLSFIVSGIFRSSKSAGAVMSIVVIAMTFMSGGIVQGEQFNTISKFTINKWISEGYVKLMSGGSLGDILLNILILFAMGTVFMIMATIIYRKENIYE